jgi:Holliday junction resolvasome RuvABC endonuclease subunit
VHRGGGLLALDAARILGWAAADRDAVAAWPEVIALDGAVGPFEGVVSGRQILVAPGMRAGSQFLAFERWLEQAISVYRPQMIACEAPLIIGGGSDRKFKTNMDAQRRGVAMWGVVQLVAARHGLATHNANNASVKKFFTGQGRGKAPVLETCRRRGWEPRDDNEADALAVLDFTVHELKRRIAA